MGGVVAPVVDITGLGSNACIIPTFTAWSPTYFWIPAATCSTGDGHTLVRTADGLDHRFSLTAIG